MSSMLRSNQFKVLAHLLVVAITFSQISTVAALIGDTDAAAMSSHELYSESLSSLDMTNCLHAKARLKRSICCSSRDCADKTCADATCVTGAHSVASAVFISQVRIASRVCSKSKIKILNNLQAGISPTSLYKPPR